MPYTVYSDFDIEQHKKTFIHYLEVVIDENGKIMYKECEENYEDDERT